MAKLYIVPTPIGNLDDITLRAVNVLRDVDFILAEDTRTTSFLLKHLGIEKKLYSHHKFNEHATVKMVAESIAAGRNAALVSDAGTPGISDPGFLLVRTCVEAEIEVETLPGATALIPALVQSGAVGQTVKVTKLVGEGPVKRRIMDMGITKGVEIYVRKVAPLGDPVEVTVRGYELSLRKADAEMIVVE